MTIRSIYHSPYLWLYILGVGIAFILGISSTPLFDEDEGFYTEGSRRMLEVGDYITIKVQGEDRYDKPALFFWIQSLSLRLFGLNEIAARIPSIIFHFSLAFLVFFEVKKKFTAERGWIAAFITFGSLQMALLGKAAIVDALLNLVLAIGMFQLWAFFETKSLKKLLFFYFFTGLAFMTKGPIAVIIPAAVTLIFAFRFKEWNILWKVLNPIGLLVFLGVVVPWFYLAYEKVGMFVFEDFFLKHNVKRFSKEMEGHGGNYFYFFPVLILGFIPFCQLIFRTLKNFKSYTTDRYEFFMITWFVFVFLLFTISSTKLPHYITYGYLPLIVLMSKYWTDEDDKWALLQTAGLTILFIIAPLVIPSILHLIGDKYVQRMLVDLNEVFDNNYYIILSLTSVLLLLLVFLKKRSFYFLPLLLMSFNFFFMKYSHLQQLPVKEAAILAKSSSKSAVALDHYLPSFSFYRGTNATIGSPSSGQLCIIKSHRLPKLNDSFKILYEKRGIALIEMK